MKCWYINNRCNRQNFECKHANVHALYRIGAGYHFVGWSSMPVALDRPIQGRLMLVVDGAEVVVQSCPIHAQLEKDLVISQAMATCRYSGEQVELQQV